MACKTCQKKMANVAGRKKTKRRRKSRINGFNMKGSGSVVTTTLGALGGVIVAKKVNSLGFVASNPILKVVAPVAGAVVTNMFLKGPMGNAVATGMYIEAGSQALQQFLPQVASTVGLSGPTAYATYLNPGVAGDRQQGVFI